MIEEYGETQKAAGYRSGKREGMLDALRLVLARRGLEPDARQLARMQACADPAALDDWLARALTAAHVDEIFLGPVGEEGRSR